MALAQPHDQGLDDRRDRGGVADRRLAVRNPELECAECGVKPKLPPPRPHVGERTTRDAPAKRLGVGVPASERRRDAVARQELGELGTDRRQPGVATFVERAVCGKRGEQGQIRARRIVHGQRTVRIAHRHVYLKRADQLAHSDRAVLLDGSFVWREPIERSHSLAERVRAGICNGVRQGH